MAKLDNHLTPKKDDRLGQRKRPMTAYKDSYTNNQSVANFSGTDANTVDIRRYEEDAYHKREKRAISEYTFCENQEVFDMIKKLEDAQKMQL